MTDIVSLARRLLSLGCPGMRLTDEERASLDAAINRDSVEDVSGILNAGWKAGKKATLGRREIDAVAFCVSGKRVTLVDDDSFIYVGYMDESPLPGDRVSIICDVISCDGKFILFRNGEHRGSNEVHRCCRVREDQGSHGEDCLPG